MKKMLPNADNRNKSWKNSTRVRFDMDLSSIKMDTCPMMASAVSMPVEKAMSLAV